MRNPKKRRLPPLKNTQNLATQEIVKVTQIHNSLFRLHREGATLEKRQLDSLVRKHSLSPKQASLLAIQLRHDGIFIKGVTCP